MAETIVEGPSGEVTFQVADLEVRLVPRFRAVEKVQTLVGGNLRKWMAGLAEDPFIPVDIQVRIAHALLDPEQAKEISVDDLGDAFCADCFETWQYVLTLLFRVASGRKTTEEAQKAMREAEKEIAERRRAGEQGNPSREP